MLPCIFLLASFVHIWTTGICSPLTFELEDRSSRCFYNQLTSGTTYHIDFQVLSGGNYDVDFTLFDPNRKIMSYRKKSSYDSIVLNDTVDGEYKACFGNLFSSVTHKVVYLSWYNDTDTHRLPVIDLGADTVIPTFMQSLDANLQKIAFWQRMERLLNTISLDFGLQLNSRVLYWSIGQSLLVLFVGVGQVIFLRSLFRVPTSRRSTTRLAS